jgi:hypothetical protein
LILTKFQGLASFTAHLCRRYSQIDPTPILEFIVHRLLQDSPPDAIILRELVSKMSGVDPLQMLADSQVAAMGGGPILQTETVASETRGALQAKPLQKSADKLLSVMYSANLMLPLLVLLARLSQQCVYSTNPNEASLKGLGSTFDDVCLVPLFLSRVLIRLLAAWNILSIRHIPVTSISENEKQFLCQSSPTGRDGRSIWNGAWHGISHVPRPTPAEHSGQQLDSPAREWPQILNRFHLGTGCGGRTGRKGCYANKRGDTHGN